MIFVFVVVAPITCCFNFNFNFVSMSETGLSETNTIQKIPIPQRRSDVEAFLDDIFDRALDNNNNNNNVKMKDKLPSPQSSKQKQMYSRNQQQQQQNQFHSKIKGGAHRNNACVSGVSSTTFSAVFSNNFDFILSTKKLNIDNNDSGDDSWSWVLQEDDDDDEDYYQNLDKYLYDNDKLKLFEKYSFKSL